MPPFLVVVGQNVEGVLTQFLTPVLIKVKLQKSPLWQHLSDRKKYKNIWTKMPVKMSNFLSIKLQDKMFIVLKPLLFHVGVQFKAKKESLCYECSLHIMSDGGRKDDVREIMVIPP